MPKTHRSVSDGDRNPLVLERNDLRISQVDTGWVARMCMQYQTKCSDPDCDNLATEIFLTLYSMTFICIKHAAETLGNEPLQKIRKVLLTDRVDIDVYSDFVHRTIRMNENVSNGYVRALDKRQLAALRKLEQMERDYEHAARIALRKRKNEGAVGDPPPANTVYLTEVGGSVWPAIEFDRRGGWEKAIIPDTLTAKRKFAPEVNETNDTGISVEDLF